MIKCVSVVGRETPIIEPNTWLFCIVKGTFGKKLDQYNIDATLGKLQCSGAAILALSPQILLHIYTTDIIAYICINIVINIINTILSYRSFWSYFVWIKIRHEHQKNFSTIFAKFLRKPFFIEQLWWFFQEVCFFNSLTIHERMFYRFLKSNQFFRNVYILSETTLKNTQKENTP